MPRAAFGVIVTTIMHIGSDQWGRVVVRDGLTDTRELLTSIESRIAEPECSLVDPGPLSGTLNLVE
jgi:hypothetical protein